MGIFSDFKCKPLLADSIDTFSNIDNVFCHLDNKYCLTI